MAKKYRMIVVSETHWDREWYLTFEQFRMKLVKMMDKLLSVLKEEPKYKYFTLDGQTIILKDYLEIRPEKRKELKELIKKGRIIIGPWYVQPDEFLVSGEALIRNLIMGHKIGQEFGNKVMKIGYLPDSFGHISQMPQILRGFRIDSFIFSRGLGDEGEALGTEFKWEAPDGTQILAVHQRRGYGNGALLPSNSKEALKRISIEKKALVPYASTENILLNNGSDHLEPQSHLPQIIEYANAHLKDTEIIHGTFRDYITFVKKSRPKLKSFKGELKSAKYANLLSGVYSTRIYIKQANERVQTFLEKWAEPFSAFAWTMGKFYPHSFLWQAWKYLLQNHAHDSIYGCGIDEVYEDMMRRFIWSEQIARNLLDEDLVFITGKIDTSTLDEDAGIIVVFNPLSTSHTKVVEVEIEIPKIEGEKFVLKDISGQIIPHQILNLEKSSPQIYEIEISKRQAKFMLKFMSSYIEESIVKWRIGKIKVKKDEQNPSLLMVEVVSVKRGALKKKVLSEIRKSIKILEDEKIKTLRIKVYPAPRAKIKFIAEDVPSFGYKTWTLSPGEESAKKDNDFLKVGENTIENEYYKVQINPDGTLKVTHKETGKVYEGLNLFKDEGDGGDEYDYSPLTQDKGITNPGKEAKISLLEKGSVKATFKIEVELKLPISLTEDRKKRSNKLSKLIVTTYLTFYSKIRRIDLKTTFNNQVKDHRLRVLFPTDIKTDYSYAEGQFDVVKRAIVPPKVKDWVQEPSLTHPHQSWVDISDEERGLTLINKGLPEYEAIKNEKGVTLALTLLRSVGWLSRGDLLTRKGDAGPGVPTPEAQCQGRQIFEYALLFHTDNWNKAKVYEEAHRHNVSLKATVTDQHKGELPLKMSFIKIEPANLIISAIKKAEERNSLIVRFYNINSEAAKGKITLYKKIKGVRLVNLNEEVEENLNLNSENSFFVEVDGHQIKTVELIFNMEDYYSATNYHE